MLKIKPVPHRGPHRDTRSPNESPVVAKFLKQLVNGVLAEFPPAYLCSHEELRKTVSETHPTVKTVVDISCEWIEKFKKLTL